MKKRGSGELGQVGAQALVRWVSAAAAKDGPRATRGEQAPLRLTGMAEKAAAEWMKWTRIGIGND